MKDPLLYWRSAVLIIFAMPGLFAAIKVSTEWGWGIAILLYGMYLALIWIALK